MCADPQPLDPAAVGPLLAEATLLEVQVTPGALHLWLDCLRRGPAGEVLPPVQLSLVGLQALAVSYDGEAVDARPSAVRVPAAARVLALAPWPLAREVTLTFNSAQEEEDLALAAEVDWLEGQPEAFAAAPARLRVAPHVRGDWPELAVHCWLGARAVLARSAGAPLDLGRWHQEHDDWWAHWADSWSDALALPALERACDVPVRGGCVDLGYRPPAVPAFAADGTSDCPGALLAPLRAWHEGLLARDWLRMAQAFPHLDRGLAAHAEEIRAECLGAGFGRWGYVQWVDDWWIEGARAKVLLRGIEHAVGCCGAEDRPVRWHYSLRRRAGGWSIHGFRVEELGPEGAAG